MNLNAAYTNKVTYQCLDIMIKINYERIFKKYEIKK